MSIYRTADIRNQKKIRCHSKRIPAVILMESRTADLSLLAQDNADNTAGNQGLKGSFQGVDKILHIPHLLLRIKPKEDLDIDPAPGPARPDTMEFMVTSQTSRPVP